MIIVCGSSHDDVLYFEKVLFNKREEVVLNRFVVSIGTVFNQELIVVNGLNGSALSSAIITYLLSKYYIDLIINVGRCQSVDKNTKTGDIVISSNIIDVNVDLSLVKNVGLGQIPGFKRDFVVQNDIITYLKKGVAMRSYVNSYNAVFLSTDNLTGETLKTLSERREIFGISDEKIVVDHNSSGMAIAATLRDVPYVSIKVVQNQIEEEEKIDNYLQVLDKYIDLGKAVTATIGDIGRNDVLRGGVGGGK